jgi:hypothetical protein
VAAVFLCLSERVLQVLTQVKTAVGGTVCVYVRLVGGCVAGVGPLSHWSYWPGLHWSYWPG